jgi:hypothetical protein
MQDYMKEFLTNKFGIIQFEIDGALNVVETRGLVPQKGQANLGDMIFLSIKFSFSKSMRKMSCKILLPSGEQNILYEIF